MNTQVVLITGALTGIGRATALAFAKEGSRIVISGRREEEGEKLVAELRGLGADAEFIRSDVRQEEDLRSLVDKTVARFGRLDAAGPDHHVSRIRQGVVHHRCLVPRGRRQDSPVISSAVAFLGSDTRLSSEGVTPYRDIRRGTMNQTIESKNKALVLEAFDTLFNKRDYAAAERYWSPNYIQHSAHIEPGRDGLFKLIKSIPPTLKYELGTIVAEKEFVIVHGRFSGFGQPVNWIAADIVRVKDGILVEHWDVIEDEATQEQSKSGQPMFGDKFPT